MDESASPPMDAGNAAKMNFLYGDSDNAPTVSTSLADALDAELKSRGNNAGAANQSTLSKTSNTPLADALDAELKSRKNSPAIQTEQAKANPSLSEQYSNDYDVAKNNALTSLVTNKSALGGILDTAGAIGEGISNAGAQTLNHFVPESVKNALTSTAQKIADAASSNVQQFGSNRGVTPKANSGEALGNTLVSAQNMTNSTYNALPDAAKHYLGDAANIGSGLMTLEGGSALISAGADVVSGTKNLLVKPPDVLAKNILTRTSADSSGILPENIDTSQIVPGSKPTLAQATGDANIASIEKQLKKNPEYNADYTALENSNENARQQYFQTHASGTPQDIETLKAQRKSVTEPLYEQAKVQPLNTAPIEPVLANFDKAIQETGEDTDAGKALIKIKGKIQSALPDTKTVSTGLLDAQGNPITKELPKSNPTQSPLVQVFKEERDKAADDAIGEDAYANAIKTHVQPLIRQLGTALESQSEPFAKAQNLYRTLSPEINSKKWLQGLDLKDNLGNFSLSKVDNAYENALSLRNSDGINPAKDLSDTQLQTMKNIRDDLQNRKRTKDLGNSVNVPNVLQQSPSLVRKVIHEGIGAGVGAGAAALTGGNPWIGALFGGTTMRGLESGAAKKAAATGSSLTNFVLNPEQYKNYLMTGIKP